MTGQAPIAIFAYRRADHLGRCLDALERCAEFSSSPVFVFIDGPKGPADSADVAKVRALAEAQLGENITVVASDANKGLAGSVIAGVTRLTEQYGRVIVIEDDLMVHPTALAWFNRGLDIYADDARVFQISGYQYEIPEYRGRREGAFQHFATTWGWATWARAWAYFDPSAEGWQAMASDPKTRQAFDAGGVYPFAEMLEKQMRGELDSWGIRWSWAVHKAGGLTLMPPQTLVQNEGFGRGATHNTVGPLKKFASGPTPRLWSHGSPPELPSEVGVNPIDEAAFRRGLLRTNALRNHKIKKTLARLGLKRFA